MESLRQLRHVIALAEHRHFGRAAAAVRLTQAALTLSIQKLEEGYGVLLFERRQGEVAITQYGEIVLEAARAATKRVTHMRRELALTRKLAVGRLIIGCDAHFANSIMAPALARLLKEYPHLEFTIENGKWSQMRERLVVKEIDLYLGFEIEGKDPEFAFENYTAPPFVGFCRRGHPILEVEDPRIVDCLNYTVVVPPTTQWIQKRIRAGTSGPTARMPAYLYTCDHAIIRRFVSDNGALGFGQLRDFESEVNAGQFRYFTVREFHSEVAITIATLERRSLPVATKLLLETIREETAQMQVEWTALTNQPLPMRSIS